MKRLLILLALFTGTSGIIPPAHAQDVGYYVAADCATLTPVISGTICLQNTTVGGLSAGTLYKYDATGWTNVSASVTGAGHAIKDEAGADLTTRSTLNFTGNLVAATDNGATSSTDVTIAIPWTTPTNHGVLVGTGNPLTMNSTSAGTAAQCLTSNGANADPTWQACATNPASNFAWSGTHSFVDGNFTILGSGDPTRITRFEVDGQTAGQTRVWSGPDATTRLLGDSDFSTTGIMARTATNTYAGRTITGTTGNVTVSNGAGTGGNPTIDLGTTAVQTDQGNTYTTGDQNLAAASSFTFPSSTGAAPTTSGRCAYDTTANRLKCGFNGSTVTLAYTTETQPLSTNLTLFAALTGVNNAIPVFTSSSAMVTSTLPPCADSGGNHLNYDSTAHTWSCGNSSTGGLSGLVTNKFLMATGATTADTSGNLSQSGGVVNASSGFTIGATPWLVFDTSAIAASDKTWTIQNTSGTILPGAAAGSFTNGHVVTAAVVGGVVTLADGGVAGTGTWTDSSTSVGTNKTIDVEGTGNVITTVSKMWLPAAGGTVAVPGLLWDTLATNAPTPSCSVGVTETTLLRCVADFPDSDGEYSLQQSFMLPSDWTGNIDLKFLWKAAATSGDVVWQATLVCRADAEVEDAAFNTASTVTDTVKGTTLQLNTASIAALTTTGCSAGELAHLKIFRQRTNASDTIAGIISLVGLEVTTRRAQ